MKRILILFLFTQFLVGVQVSFAQKVYRNEMGGIITRAQYEKQILEGPYFGVPGKDSDEQVLVYRMPFGQVDNPTLFYTALELEEVQKLGKPIVVIFYSGKDECNSTGLTATNKIFHKKDHGWLQKNIDSKGGYGPIYLYKNPAGLEKYAGIMTWHPDPEGLFEQTFFKFPYPCRSFVVIDPSGNYRAILGEFPNTQIIAALKTLSKSR
ncbi:hypothetical protein [Algoriphagus antarcticus]|nr:hypothetical protein [Algoriphagus antarcticus]